MCATAIHLKFSSASGEERATLAQLMQRWKFLCVISIKKEVPSRFIVISQVVYGNFHSGVYVTALVSRLYEAPESRR